MKTGARPNRGSRDRPAGRGARSGSFLPRRDLRGDGSSEWVGGRGSRPKRRRILRRWDTQSQDFLSALAARPDQSRGRTEVSDRDNLSRSCRADPKGGSRRTRPRLSAG